MSFVSDLLTFLSQSRNLEESEELEGGEERERRGRGEGEEGTSLMTSRPFTPVSSSPPLRLGYQRYIRQNLFALHNPIRRDPLSPPTPIPRRFFPVLLDAHTNASLFGSTTLALLSIRSHGYHFSLFRETACRFRKISQNDHAVGERVSPKFAEELCPRPLPLSPSFARVQFRNHLSICFSIFSIHPGKPRKPK